MSKNNFLHFYDFETFQAIKLLLENGFERDKRNHEQKTPLHNAAENGHFESVLILGQACPEVINATDELGRTPLLLSAINGHV